ncbi:hypothetical protein HDU89_007988 [Geranomyces variabilis]|nr:hypothetical protein HDU89_007988 [Geranomyces variabilis]
MALHKLKLTRTELKTLKAREESLVAALDLNAVHEVNDIETVIRAEIDSLYESLFEPLPFGIFAKEDALRLQGQEANSALLRNRAILEELNQATPLLQQASNALESVCGHDGDSLNASHETLSSLILADTALHAAWSHLTDASFISDVSELPDLNFSSPCPQEQVARIAAELQPAVAFLIESTQEYTVNINNELVRGTAVVAEIESRLQRERRRLVLECAGADDDARLRDMPPGYEDHVGSVPTAAPPGYDHSFMLVLALLAPFPEMPSRFPCAVPMVHVKFASADKKTAAVTGAPYIHPNGMKYIFATQFSKPVAANPRDCHDHRVAVKELSAKEHHEDNPNGKSDTSKQAWYDRPRFPNVGRHTASDPLRKHADQEKLCAPSSSAPVL